MEVQCRHGLFEVRILSSATKFMKYENSKIWTNLKFGHWQRSIRQRYKTHITSRVRGFNWACLSLWHLHLNSHTNLRANRRIVALDWLHARLLSTIFYCVVCNRILRQDGGYDAGADRLVVADGAVRRPEVRWEVPPLPAAARQNCRRIRWTRRVRTEWS